MSSQDRIKVLTLNCWGLKYIAAQRLPRLRAIGDELSVSDYDLIALQEIWVHSDFEYVRQKVARRLPFAKFYFSGAFGAGLVIFSRWPIISTSMLPYSLNGIPIEVHTGDWMVGKAAACAVIDHPMLGEVEVISTHFIAAGGETGPEYKRGHRLTQAWELSNLVLSAAQKGRHVICMGDLNSTPASLTIALLRSHALLHDAFLASHRHLSPTAIALPSSPSATGNPFPNSATAVRELGVTCDSPLNSWTAGKKLDGPASKAAGKRLDYIFWRGPEERVPVSAPVSAAEEADVDAGGAIVDGWRWRWRSTGAGRLRAQAARVVMTGNVPGLPFSFSDHFGVEAVFSVAIDEGGTVEGTARAGTRGGRRSTDDSTRRGSASLEEGWLSDEPGVPPASPTFAAEVLSSTLQALHTYLRHSSLTARLHLYAFFFALFLAIGLAVASAFIPSAARGVEVVFVVLAVAAGWAGTTALYSTVIWGQWEKRAVRERMDEMNREVERIKDGLPSSAAAGGSPSNPGRFRD